MSTINAYVLKHILTFEMIGVLIHIFSFNLVSWLGPAIYPRNGSGKRNQISSPSRKMA